MALRRFEKQAGGQGDHPEQQHRPQGSLALRCATGDLGNGPADLTQIG